MRHSIYGKCIAKQRDGIYTKIVIEDLNEFNQYHLVTIRPNWNCEIPNLDDIGIYTLEEIRFGDKFLDVSGDIFEYRYENLYFINFMKLSKKQNYLIIT